MIVATNGEKEARVKIVHWWPGREYYNPGMGTFFRAAARIKGGSRYITAAYADVGHRMAQGMAYCCPKDTPSRARGRTIALGRLEKELRDLGYRLECREKGAGE